MTAAKPTMRRKSSMRIEHPAWIVLSGPSGVGKSTVLRKLRETQPDFYFSVSATTRAITPR